MLYEMLSGRPPFQGRTLAEVVSRRLASDPPPPSTLQPGLSAAVDHLVLRALAREPAQRYASAAEFRDALRACGSDGPAVTQTVRISRVVRPPIDSSVGAARGSEPGRPNKPSRTPRWTAGLSTWLGTRWLPIAAATVLCAVIVVLLRAGHAAPPVVAPELTGRHMSEVPALLDHQHLQLGDISTSATDPARAGTVVSQQPAAGQQMAAGSRVQLVIGVAR